MAIQKSLKNRPNGLYGDIPIDSILRCWKCGSEFHVEQGEGNIETANKKSAGGGAVKMSRSHLPTAISFGLILFAVLFFSACAAVRSERSGDNTLPEMSVDEVINITSSMEGKYPVRTYGTYKLKYFWMDNQKIILNVKDENRGMEMISWDVDSGSTQNQGAGRAVCFADGKIFISTYLDEKLATSESVFQKGPLGQEEYFEYDKTVRVYDHSLECGNKPSTEITRHAKEHLEDVLTALRPEHGFLVTAKRSYYPDGRTKDVLQQDEIVYHPNGRAPVHIPMKPWWEGSVDAYYPFVRAYAFENNVRGQMDLRSSGTWMYRQNANGEVVGFSADGKSMYRNAAFILGVNGEVRKVKVPDVLVKGYGVAGPYLSRKGIIWLGGSVRPNKGSGIYLARGEQVKRISSDNIKEGKVSPNGCRLAYTATSRRWIRGGISKPVLKVIDLCEGEK